MRAVLVGLLGSVLAVGVAQAGECRLDGLELVDVVYGTHYQVKKVSSRFWRQESPEVNDHKPDGYVLALIEGGGQKLVISQSYSAFGSPNNSGSAELATKKNMEAINTGVRSSKAERLRVDGSFNLQTGHLGDTRLVPVNCK